MDRSKSALSLCRDPAVAQFEHLVEHVELRAVGDDRKQSLIARPRTSRELDKRRARRLRIELRRRLVEDEKARICKHCPGEHEPPPPAA